MPDDLPAVPVKMVREVVGTVLIGALINCMLFMLEITMLWRYISKTSNGDRMYIRILVSFMFLVDVLATCNACAMVFLYTIEHFGDASFLAQQNVTVPIYSLTLAVSVVCMHAFLIYRYAILSKRWYVAIVLACLSGAGFIGDVLATWSVIRYTSLSDRAKLATYAKIWLSSQMAADLCIAAALIYELVAIQATFSKTKSLLRRLMRTALVTGCFTAALAILALMTYLMSPMTNICLVFGISIGRVCSITVLYNLNMRRGGLANSNINFATEDVMHSFPMESRVQFRAPQTDLETQATGNSVKVVHTDSAGSDEPEHDSGRYKDNEF